MEAVLLGVLIPATVLASKRIELKIREVNIAVRTSSKSILKEVDSVIYVDADALVLADIKSLWSHFTRFDSAQMIGIVKEAEHPSVSYYNANSVSYPFYGQVGMNTGVCLFNLTRMRAFGFERHILDAFAKYKQMHLRYGDQCLMNIVFSLHPGMF